MGTETTKNQITEHTQDWKPKERHFDFLPGNILAEAIMDPLLFTNPLSRFVLRVGEKVMPMEISCACSELRAGYGWELTKRNYKRRCDWKK
ncbi:hypothetical protein HOG48_01010 [Candidatus Peregrinibacteria bacterium]|jgi:hypothetical protein|nr:hypothetical protein [Candidatus Peregrinibacteria bacterium]